MAANKPQPPPISITLQGRRWALLVTLSVVCVVGGAVMTATFALGGALLRAFFPMTRMEAVATAESLFTKENNTSSEEENDISRVEQTTPTTTNTSREQDDSYVHLPHTSPSFDELLGARSLSASDLRFFTYHHLDIFYMGGTSNQRIIALTYLAYFEEFFENRGKPGAERVFVLNPFCRHGLDNSRPTEFTQCIPPDHVFDFPYLNAEILKVPVSALNGGNLAVWPSRPRPLASYMPDFARNLGKVVRLNAPMAKMRAAYKHAEQKKGLFFAASNVIPLWFRPYTSTIRFAPHLREAAMRMVTSRVEAGSPFVVVHARFGDNTRLLWQAPGATAATPEEEIKERAIMLLSQGVENLTMGLYDTDSAAMTTATTTTKTNDESKRRPIVYVSTDESPEKLRRSPTFISRFLDRFDVRFTREDFFLREEGETMRKNLTFRLNETMVIDPSHELYDDLTGCVEVLIAACAPLGFVGTMGSTFSHHIKDVRNNLKELFPECRFDNKTGGATLLVNGGGKVATEAELGSLDLNGYLAPEENLKGLLRKITGETAVVGL